jgi:DNA-binding SARP family transcriptional activator
VSLGGRRVDRLLPGRQGRVLFAYLVLNRSRDATADELVTALWHGGGPDRADATLRTLISKVRRAVGMETLGREELGVNPSPRTRELHRSLLELT